MNWFFFYIVVRSTASVLPCIYTYVRIKNRSIDTGVIHWYTILSWYHIRLLNKFQSFILIGSVHSSIVVFFELFYYSVFWTCNLLHFIRYDGQRIRLTHPRVALPYINYKCNTWVSKSDSLPFIPNKIKQREMPL